MEITFFAVLGLLAAALVIFVVTRGSEDDTETEPVLREARRRDRRP